MYVCRPIIMYTPWRRKYSIYTNYIRHSRQSINIRFLRWNGKLSWGLGEGIAAQDFEKEALAVVGDCWGR